MTELSIIDDQLDRTDNNIEAYLYDRKYLHR
jgi:hypothetical protein